MSTSHEDLRLHPGHLIRRAQQVHYWLWNAEVSGEVTSPQFAVLYALRAEKNIDQKTLGERVSLDRSTTAEVVARLKARGLIQRFRDPRDGRRNLLRLTAAGVRTTERLIPKAVRMNRLLVSALSEREQSELLRMLNRVVDAVERRVRAGVLEQGSADLLTSTGVGERMIGEGLVHDGIKLRFAGEEHRIDFRRLTGKGITVYGQQEVVKDLIEQRQADRGEIWFEAEATAVEGIEDDHPRIAYRRNGEDASVTCEFVAGCDGSHGIAHEALAAKSYERSY